jgi:hypothetical protein
MQANTVYSYTFNELSDSAKETARNHYRQYGLDYEWWDCTFDDWKAALLLIGIDVSNIYFSGFSSQGDGACFECEYSYVPGWRKAVKSEFGGSIQTTLLTAGERLQAIQRPFFYGVTATVKHSGRYSHSNSTDFTVDPGERFESSDIIELEDDIESALRELMDDLYNDLEDEYDYLTSDSVIDEYLQDGDWQFLESGDMY